MENIDRSHHNELTIGELALMCRLTVRALRHYDDIGLLAPARVDPANGYRYYDTGQIETASTIAVLRSLDIDVPTIADLLNGTQRLAEVVTAERERAQRQARRAAASLAVLQSLESPNKMETPKIVTIEPFRLVGTSIRVLASNDIEAAGQAFADLFAVAKAANVEHDPDAICIINGSSREELHLEIAVRLLGDDEPAIDGYQTRTIDGGPTANLTHSGPLQSLPLGHARLNSWILDQGREIGGSPREVFLGDLDDHRTRIEVPLQS